jgi:hypothetical protein
MNLESTRPRGRPRNRWQDEVREDGRIVGGEEWQEKYITERKLLRTAKNHRILHMPINSFRSYVGPRPTLWFSCSQRFSWSLILSIPIFLPPAYSPALIYFGRERGWWITCNYPTVLKKKYINRNRKIVTCDIFVRYYDFSVSDVFFSCSTDFSQQIVQIALVLFLFTFFSFKTVG